MTAQLKANYIAGEWLAGSDVNCNINPSDTGDIVGEYDVGLDGTDRFTTLYLSNDE